MPRHALAVALLLMSVARALADVAATGTFGIQLNGLPPNVPFSGDITFDPGAHTALGRSVDMAADVGDMTFEGDAVVNVAQRSATFDLGAESAGDFEFTAAGAGSCETAGCVSGRGTFAGRFTTITDPGDVLDGGIFTFDGTAAIDAQGKGPGGSFAINAFPLTLTQVGANVEVSSTQTFFDTRSETVRLFAARARFASVATAGATQFVAFSALPGALPTGIVLDPVVSAFVDVTTNAMVSGGVRLCLGYADANGDGLVDGTAGLAASRLRLLYATAIGAAFADVTTSVESQRVCGDAAAPGPIVLALGPAPSATTTTVPAGVSTTTTFAIAPGGPTTTSTTLPVCGSALGCLDVAIAGPLCPGETINPKLTRVVAKKLAKARQALQAARATTAAKRIAKLIAKARTQLGKVTAKADVFVAKRTNPISAACRDAIGAAVGNVIEQIAANRI